jgi:hypothetical protein
MTEGSDHGIRCDAESASSDPAVPIVSPGATEKVALARFLAEASARMAGTIGAKRAEAHPSDRGAMAAYGRNFENYARNFENYARNFENYGRSALASSSTRDPLQTERPATLPNGRSVPPSAKSIRNR